MLYTDEIIFAVHRGIFYFNIVIESVKSSLNSKIGFQTVQNFLI